MIVRRLGGLPTVPQGFAELGRLRSELDELFGDQRRFSFGSSAGVFPLINLSEDNANIYIRAELPGIKADDISISVTGKSLLLSGERKIAAGNGSASYHRREREAGSFRRAVTLPADFDADKVAAQHVNGVLTITLPKAEAAKPRQISVKAS